MNKKIQRSKYQPVNKEFIKQFISVDPETCCWNWCRCCFKHGYGAIRIKRKTYNVARVAYNLWKGIIPKGMLVCHKCDNRKCVNPKHLFLGTYVDNFLDMINKGRQSLGTNPLRGSKNHMAILKEKDVKKIKRSSLPYRELAIKYGVHKDTIYKILNGTNWKHIK